MGLAASFVKRAAGSMQYFDQYAPVEGKSSKTSHRQNRAGRAPQGTQSLDTTHCAEHHAAGVAFGVDSRQDSSGRAFADESASVDNPDANPSNKYGLN